MSIPNKVTKTYNQQSYGQVERYNPTIVVALWTYLAKNAQDWDVYKEALTYAYNCQPHK